MPTILDVLLEADPASLEVMRQRIKSLADKEDPKIAGIPSFVRLQRIPQLHFMSMQIFEDTRFDPLLVFENNFDGSPDLYWKSVLSQLSDDLRLILACTKQAKEKKWEMLFVPGSDESLVSFLMANSCSPSAGHFGAVANSLPRILRDHNLFEDLQTELGVTAAQYRTSNASSVHDSLRQWALNRYTWLQQPETPTTDQAIDAYKSSAWQPILPGLIALVVLVTLFLTLCFSRFLPDHGFAEARLVLRVLLILAGISISIATVFFRRTLRHLEATDLTQEAPRLTPEQLKLFATQEDQIVQNHLAGIVLVKPGVIRGFLIRAALRLLKFGVPLTAWNGYLGAMRTIHFAHWTLVGNSGRLLFLSNFDGSWQSYLDDFVDKASRGLTLAWGNCIGFPRTRDLVLEGAAHGTQFKAWARLSQTQNMLWYSAYPTLTVNQIIRNASIVDGLRNPSMKPTEAEQWARLL